MKMIDLSYKILKWRQIIVIACDKKAEITEKLDI